MKKLKDTKIGAFLKEKAPDVLSVVGDLLPDSGTLGIVKNVIEKVAPEKAPELNAELESKRMEFEKELFELSVKDRDSARNREIELAKAGGQDWLMYIAGLTALGTFLLMVWAVIFLGDELGENSLFHQLMGIIEGVALTVFSYYFGSSKGSKDKDSKK